LKILVPYVSLRPELKLALASEGIGAVFVDTSGPEAYWQILSDYWAKCETFIVLEQDKVPEPGLLREMWDCPFSWCSAQVPIQGSDKCSPYPSLSCTKFGQRLMDEFPDLLEEVGKIDFGFGLKEWSRLDLGISALLSIESEVHWHGEGRVEHLHDL
jgi:hypothetical protein